MLLLGSVAPWMLLVFLGQHLSLSSASVRTKSRGAGRGRFTLEDNMQCTWTTRDSKRAVRLLVKCEDPEARVKGGITELKCEYNAKPKFCPAFNSDPAGFWKQVGRALNRLQGKVCRDERALVKAGMCKRAPRDVNFKLDINSAVESAQSGGDMETTTPPQLYTSTTTQSSTSTSTGSSKQSSTSTSTQSSSTSSSSVRPSACHKKSAEEYCSSSWASVCSFFFSVLQNDC